MRQSVKQAPIIGRLSPISSAFFTNSSPNSAVSDAHSYGSETLVESVSAVVAWPWDLWASPGGKRKGNGADQAHAAAEESQFVCRSWRALRRAVSGRARFHLLRGQEPCRRCEGANHRGGDLLPACGWTSVRGAVMDGREDAACKRSKNTPTRLPVPLAERQSARWLIEVPRTPFPLAPRCTRKCRPPSPQAAAGRFAGGAAETCRAATARGGPGLRERRAGTDRPGQQQRAPEKGRVAQAEKEAGASARGGALWSSCASSVGSMSPSRRKRRIARGTPLSSRSSSVIAASWAPVTPLSSFAQSTAVDRRRGWERSHRSTSFALQSTSGL